MAKKTPIFLDSELPIHSTIKEDEKLWSEVEDLAKVAFETDNNGQAKKAVSNKASGRNCPKCASRLRVKEVTENYTVILICWNCHSTWHNTDLESAFTTDEKGNEIVDAVSDNMWRRIDDATINHWMEYFAKYKKKD